MSEGARSIGFWVALAGFVAATAGLAMPVLAQATKPQLDPLTDLSKHLLSDQHMMSVPTSHSAARPPASNLTPQLPMSGFNFSAVSQKGDHNFASVDLAGFKNVTLQSQIGSENRSVLNAAGSHNQISTFQLGHRHQTSISVVGQDNHILNSQIGSNLSFNFQQIGNGKTVTILQVNAK